MCGIIGYIGKDNKTLRVLIDGLKALEYRGYDSAGIIFNDKDKLNIIKSVGKIAELENKINFEIDSKIGLGHTRWATHGVPNEINCHPHQVNKITIVHNGIIENYEELKIMLMSNGYSFKTDTDTEVGCALIDFLYNESKDIVKALHSFKGLVKGSYALGVIVDNCFDKIYAIRKDSPLIIAVSDAGNYVTSDVIAINKYSDKVIYLEENLVAEITYNEIKIYNNELELVNNVFVTIDMVNEEIDKNGYSHYMLKEINEQPRVFNDTVSLFIKEGVDSLINKMPDFSKYNRIDIVACGSAYHTGLVGKALIEEYADILVNVEVASEYRYRHLNYDDKTLVMAVSQSGETADTLAVVRKANEDKIDTLAIVNVENSTIMRESKYSLLVKAGREIAVATTKAYSAQIAMLSLIALNIGYVSKKISVLELNKILDEMKLFSNELEKVLYNEFYKDVAYKMYLENDIFFIGRGIDYAISMEGSLKLKEISYIPSQAYPAGELKHGTISLIEEGTFVVGIITDDLLAEKTISNIKEVKARGARVVLITNNDYGDYDFYDYKLVVPKVSKFLQPLLTIIPLQLLAYEIARLRNCDIDKPKNLAKSVTVE